MHIYIGYLLLDCHVTNNYNLIFNNSRAAKKWSNLEKASVVVSIFGGSFLLYKGIDYVHGKLFQSGFPNRY